MRDQDRKIHLASLTDRLVKREIGRRDFLKAAATLGLGAGALGLGLHRGRFNFVPDVSAAEEALQPSAEVLKWVADVGKPFAGTTLKLATESTPPSNALNSQLKKYFEKASDIRVDIEVLPLDQVLAKHTRDVADKLGAYDLYYIDQSWAATFGRDVFDPREQLENTQLAMPDYDIGAFLPALVDNIAMFEDRMVGVPYDIPIFIMIYRRDIYDRFGLKAPATLAELLSNAEIITREMGPKIYGTTGQMKAGHYALECDWTAWLWGHGGSIFRPDGTFAGNDDQGLAAMDYWTKLKKTMPPGVGAWTWDEEGKSVADGVAASMLSWGEFFPYLDDPSRSKVSGLCEVSVPPTAIALRTKAETAFNETPGVGHQGGSSLAVSRYSKNPDAAWVFMQWATCADTQALITALGGGTGPTRSSVYDDPRVKANARVGAGTTRHLPVIRETIAKHMGSEPDLPQWARLSTETIPIGLGKYFAGGYGSAKIALDDIAAQLNAVLKP